MALQQANKKNKSIIIVGVSYFSSMASAMRVRNLFKPLTFKENILIKNIVINYPGKKKQFENKTNNDRIEYRVLFYNLINIFSILSYIIKSFLIIKQMKQKDFDNILYVYGYPDLEKIFIILFSKIFNYKIIYDINEDIFTIKDFSGLKARISVYSSIILIKKLSWYADGVIVISFHLKKLFDNISNKKIPVDVVPISVDLSNFPSIHPNPNGRIKLFYAGSFGEKDGIDILLSAFESISHLYINLDLVMTGTGPKRHMEKFYDLLRKNNSKNRIYYKGYLGLNDYYSTLNNCDIMCMTRNSSAFANGGFPFKLGEYLASGKAVIASDVSDIKYYLKNKTNAILIKPDSKDELIVAIETLVCNRNLRIKIGKEGRKIAKKYFDNYFVSEKFLSFIEKIL